MKTHLLAAALIGASLCSAALAQAPAPAPAAQAAKPPTTAAVKAPPAATPSTTPSGATNAVRDACKDDFKKFCPAQKGAERTACLETNREKFTDACKTAWSDARKQRTAAITDACATDAKSFCADVKRGGGKIRECLKANADKLSAACKAFVAKAAGNKEAAGNKATASPQPAKAP